MESLRRVWKAHSEACQQSAFPSKEQFLLVWWFQWKGKKKLSLSVCWVLPGEVCSSFYDLCSYGRPMCWNIQCRITNQVNRNSFNTFEFMNFMKQKLSSILLDILVSERPSPQTCCKKQHVPWRHRNNVNGWKVKQHLLSIKSITCVSKGHCQTNQLCVCFVQQLRSLACYGTRERSYTGWDVEGIFEITKIEPNHFLCIHSLVSVPLIK